MASMQQLNDKELYYNDHSSYLVRAKLEQIRSKIFNQKSNLEIPSLKSPILNYQKNYLNNAKQTITVRVNQDGSNKEMQNIKRGKSLNGKCIIIPQSYQHNKINNKENNYQFRIKNLDSINFKIKTLLDQGIKIPNLNEKYNYNKLYTNAKDYGNSFNNKSKELIKYGNQSKNKYEIVNQNKIKYGTVERQKIYTNNDGSIQFDIYQPNHDRSIQPKIDGNIQQPKINQQNHDRNMQPKMDGNTQQQSKIYQRQIKEFNSSYQNNIPNNQNSNPTFEQPYKRNIQDILKTIKTNKNNRDRLKDKEEFQQIRPLTSITLDNSHNCNQQQNKTQIEQQKEAKHHQRAYYSREKRENRQIRQYKQNQQNRQHRQIIENREKYKFGQEIHNVESRVQDKISILEKDKKGQCEKDKENKEEIKIQKTQKKQQKSTQLLALSKELKRQQKIQYSKPKQIIKHSQSEQEKIETVKLAQILGKQVLHDQKMRAFRNIFGEIGNQDKWNKLKRQLESSNIFLKIQELKEELVMSADQHNPFQEDYGNTDEIECIKNLAKFYIESNRFWRTALTGCTSIERLQRQGFTIKDIDLNKKGYLSIQDLVCFINLYSGNFFRNRDVIMMHRRFNKGRTQDKLTYQRFLEIVIG